MSETDSTTVWMTLEQAASYAKTSAATLRREAKNGRLRGYKVGGRRCWRFTTGSIDAWYEATNADGIAQAAGGGAR